MSTCKKLSRRKFLFGSALAVVGVAVTGCTRREASAWLPALVRCRSTQDVTCVTMGESPSFVRSVGYAPNCARRPVCAPGTR